MSSHCETGLVSRRILGLLASCQSLPRALVREGRRQRQPAPTSALTSLTHLRLVLADSPATHGLCSRRIAETKKPRQDALCCGWGEATGAFLSERDPHGHTPPSHNLRPHSGPVPLAVGEGIPPLEHKGAQVEAPQECSADPPWACGRGAWQIGVPVGGAHAGKACLS